MDWHRIPSLNALRAFSAVAETGSYSRAGASLNVTHAAIMQQVKALEDRFDVALVVRSGRGVSLTEEGRDLAQELKEAFNHIQAGVDTLNATALSKPLQVTMSPVFAVKWLMPRIADFQARHPEITLLLHPNGRIVDLETSGIDVAIRYSRTCHLPKDADVLIELDLVVVGTPDLLEPHDISKPSDLINLPWMQELGTREVSNWFERHDVLISRPLMITHMPGNLIIDAVLKGDAVTYTCRQWLAEEITSGKLVELFPEEAEGSFYIHTAPNERRRQVRKFVEWLKSQTTS